MKRDCPKKSAQDESLHSEAAAFVRGQERASEGPEAKKCFHESFVV